MQGEEGEMWRGRKVAGRWRAEVRVNGKEAEIDGIGRRWKGGGVEGDGRGRETNHDNA